MDECIVRLVDDILTYRFVSFQWGSRRQVGGLSNSFGMVSAGLEDSESYP